MRARSRRWTRCRGDICRDRAGALALGTFCGDARGGGLPLYIHAPKLYAERYGIGLGTRGAVLGGLRLLDVVQDPALGWIAERFRVRRGVLVTGALMVTTGAMAAMAAMLSVVPPVAPAVWFALTMGLVTVAYSFLTIVFYAQGVVWAQAQGGAHLRLAGWREAGTLVGVSVAAVLPSVLPGGTGSFGWVFVAMALLAGLAMRGDGGPLDRARCRRGCLRGGWGIWETRRRGFRCGASYPSWRWHWLR